MTFTTNRLEAPYTEEVLVDPPPVALTAKVAELLRVVPKHGPEKVNARGRAHAERQLFLSYTRD
jgi:hypothetical protein